MGQGRWIGFIGLGVMGEPMCRNLARKCASPVIAYDQRQEPLERLSAHGVRIATSLEEVATLADVVMLSLPSGKEVATICCQAKGLIALARPGQTVIDLGTSPVSLTRELARRFNSAQADFADAPVARTRAAAEQGTLSVMVGASEIVFRRIEPLLRCFATDVTHCGDVGAGQFVKIVNNMVLFQTGVALAEALVLAKHAGIAGDVLFETLAKGSADSFALRNHGMKAMIPEKFPEQAFSAEYALKDIGYALELGAEAKVHLRGAELAAQLLRETIERGYGKEYWPALIKVVGPPK
jgi:3-hydroxyisobutyrate dehydrogenase-like beta-hydroxyacid dehydrogenase